jgi:hypothetical protein
VSKTTIETHARQVTRATHHTPATRFVDVGAARRSIGSIMRGVGAGVLGTLAMDVLLYRRYRHHGGDAGFADWESSDGLVTWENAPAPALVAKRLLEDAFKHEVPPRYARSLNNATHWGFGLANGAMYGLLLGPRRRPKVWAGVPFSVAVWASGYVVLPQLGVYEPIWKYDLRTLQEDLGAHLVFGTGTAAAFWLLTRLETEQRRRRHGRRNINPGGRNEH